MTKSKKYKTAALKSSQDTDFYKKFSLRKDKADRLNDIRDYKPVFAFDYISLNESKFCFNSTLINGRKDYGRLFQSLKDISSKSYNELSTNYTYHFHEADFKDNKFSISRSDFLKCISQDINSVTEDNTPTVYQFKVFEEARIFGFVFNGVFYLVFFDRGHNAYKRK